MAKATLSPVQFHGSTIFVVTHKGEPYAPIKPIVEDMGLAWQTQQRKLTANKERWGITIMVTPSASGNQDTLCMPVRKLPAFFASINPNKVRPELRDRIRLYQDECDDGTTGQRGKPPGGQRPPCPPYPNQHGRSRQPPRWNASVPSNGSSSRSVQNWNIACAMPTGCPAMPCRTT